MIEANSPHFWETRYQNNQFPWDLGGPTPVFARLAAQGQLMPGAMMVLGAGRGHDARLFARHGFAVTAVDFATAAINAMQTLADPDYPLEIVHSDFFTLPATFNGHYQYVLDYTSFCAIQPHRRGEYADLVARLLQPGGQLVTLAFPIGTRAGGPPFTVQPDAIIGLFAARGFTLQHRESPPDSVPERRPYEELLILAK
ncbi:MAG: methyltransferase domain-containing protein [Chloroflexi bacterium]|nr:methyltransferase domain-containing protein [Ardenticatenaceae bacterium]MBL1129335.1 methyltransferase domain-containing protein [Chloroflexota bacterium]NOG35413.1 methyltransferase domain-containing protein [Chloroflexota bacterium]GIK58645.1 MAG: SAM-dependent methyltransferase [Chloroflexota bacterium]